MSSPLIPIPLSVVVLFTLTLLLVLLLVGIDSVRSSSHRLPTLVGGSSGSSGSGGTTAVEIEVEPEENAPEVAGIADGDNSDVVDPGVKNPPLERPCACGGSRKVLTSIPKNKLPKEEEGKEEWAVCGDRDDMSVGDNDSVVIPAPSSTPILRPLSPSLPLMNSAPTDEIDPPPDWLMRALRRRASLSTSVAGFGMLIRRCDVERGAPLLSLTASRW